MTKLSFPFTAKKIRALKIGGEVLISGGGCAGRDAALRGAHLGIKSLA